MNLIDNVGNTWKTPQIKGRLKFRIPSHLALREFVFTVMAASALDAEAQTELLRIILSLEKTVGSILRNLQTLCMICNARKVSTEDKPFSTINASNTTEINEA